MGVYQRPKTFKKRFEFVGDLFPALSDRRSQRAGSLSGGERQMVAMGRALMMEPSVLLLDEPSAGLSPVMQDEVFVQTRRINRAGVSVVMVEQNASRCLQICDRGYVLDQGRNAYTGTRQGPGQRPQGHRALPRHAGQGLAALTARTASAGHANEGPDLTVGPLRSCGCAGRGSLTRPVYSSRPSCTCCPCRTGRCRWCALVGLPVSFMSIGTGDTVVVDVLAVLDQLGALLEARALRCRPWRP